MLRKSTLVLGLLSFSGFVFAACQSNPTVSGDGDANATGSAGEGGAFSGNGTSDVDIEVTASGDGGTTTSDSGEECVEDADSCEWKAPPPEPACGDGRINQSGETCDDGNGKSGDGCTANCIVEADFVCSTPGQPCVSSVVCGDGKLSGGETCDDSNTKSGDGCSDSCQLEAGWSCATAGLRCEAAECGDGIVAGAEECDLGDSTDGCVGCKIVDGYDCDSESCFLTECGNGKVERGETCEDGNDRPFDGCYDCGKEPSCKDGVCTAVCGDGQRYDSEACDDGNRRDGDGCSSLCEIEEGFSCRDIVGEPPESVLLPVIFRDFIGKRQSLIDTATCYDARAGELPTDEKTIPCFHVNFDGLSGTSLQDVVEVALGADGTPDLDCPGDDCSSNPGVQTNNFTTNEDFEDWYNDASPQNIPIVRELLLSQDSGSTYSFKPSGGFYPIDDAGWVLSGEELLRSGSDGGCGSAKHNYSFTTETRFIFEYQGGERFDFNGDDDLWVFVNGKLAIDLAGLHGPRAGYFQLDADDDGEGTDDVADGTAVVDNPLIDEKTIDLGLSPGGIYEVALFHAERNYCGSNFELTLKDFNKPKSKCESTCGDGVVASDELCDDGESGNDGSFGKCGVDCVSRGPFCGDGIVQKDEGELCDDGMNLSTHGDGCAPGCKKPAFCGDGEVQSAFEDCDDGKNEGGYDECDEGCVLGPHCGDGKVQKDAGEECDDGNRANDDGCNVNCKSEIELVR